MIGVFDSGFGGLTVFKEIELRLPNYNYIYLGDNARAPYGNNSQEVIYEYTRQAVDYLFAQDCKLVILACNTASSEALRKLQQEYVPQKYPGKNVLGVIRPLAEAAAEFTKNKMVGVMGTRSTVESKSYIKELKKRVKDIKVLQQACPLLVPLVEENWESHPATKMILKKYIEPLKNNQPDTIILACTHYGWLQKDIVRYFGKQIKVLDSAKIVSEKLVDYLQRHPEYVSPGKKRGQRIFFTTDNHQRFAAAAQKYLGRKIIAKTISLNIK